MGIKIKAGTTFLLPVEIEDENFANISAIEFLFKQNKNGQTLKTAYWSAEGESRDAELKDDTQTIMISFSRDDSYLFRQNSTFFMDTRIHYGDTPDNPFTKIISLTMNETLFAPGEEVVP